MELNRQLDLEVLSYLAYYLCVTSHLCYFSSDEKWRYLRLSRQAMESWKVAANSSLGLYDTNARLFPSPPSVS